MGSGQSVKEKKIINYIVIEGEKKLWEECTREQQTDIGKENIKQIGKRAFSNCGTWVKDSQSKEEPAE